LHALLYVQSDGTLLVNSDHSSYAGAYPDLLSFSELVQRLDPIHVYKIKPITLWQSAALGYTARQILHVLREHAAHPIPYPLQCQIVAEVGKWGKLLLQKGGRGRIVLRGDKESLERVRAIESLRDYVIKDRTDGILLNVAYRAEIKRVLIHEGVPVVDQVGYQSALSVPLELSNEIRLRAYQSEAIEAFFQEVHGESGVVVLPCGAGKTLVGIGVMQRLQLHTLILTPNESSAKQWVRELIDKTTLSPAHVSLYAPKRNLTPITVTTYQRVAAKNRKGDRLHLRRLTSHPFGLVIYDEVHMLPAPLFRLAADLQGARRLGLTATLIREDGAETDVFSLIGAKCYEVPWKRLEQQGYLATVRCFEVRVPLSDYDNGQYLQVKRREQHRLAAQNKEKIRVVEHIVHQHDGESILIIGHYLELLNELSIILQCPIITGDTVQSDREDILRRFRSGEVRCIVLSRVANMAVDLPRASVGIQVSGLFGSRQEEAQRLGRLLRPETKEGTFYTLVSANTVEQRIAEHRQLYLVEQGYQYEVVDGQSMFEKGMTLHETV
jgi:DNA excision repair protein ERCC-3